MEGAIDIRLVVSLASTLVAIAGAAAVARVQIKQLIQQLGDLEARHRGTDRRIDKLDNATESQEVRLKTLSGILSPDALRRDHYELSALISDVKYLREEVASQHRMHNTVHPPVANTRTAE